MNIVGIGCYRSFIGAASTPLSFIWIHSTFLAGFSSVPSSNSRQAEPRAIEAPLHHQLCQLRCNSIVTALTSAKRVTYYLIVDRVILSPEGESPAPSPPSLSGHVSEGGVAPIAFTAP